MEQQQVERDDDDGYVGLRDAAGLLGYEKVSFYDARVRARLGLKLYRIEPTGALRFKRADVLALVVAAE